MVEAPQRNQEKKQCLLERTIQMQEKLLELDTIVIHLDQNTKQDIGLVENGNNKGYKLKNKYKWQILHFLDV
jgi:hypothetical protein